MTLFYWLCKFCQRRCTWRTPWRYERPVIQLYAEMYTYAYFSLCPLVKAHAAIIVNRTQRHAEVHTQWLKVRSAALQPPWPHLNSLTPVALLLPSCNNSCSVKNRPFSAPKETPTTHLTACFFECIDKQFSKLEVMPSI